VRGQLGQQVPGAEGEDAAVPAVFAAGEELLARARSGFSTNRRIAKPPASGSPRWM
jgi:hypothetical protein